MVRISKLKNKAKKKHGSYEINKIPSTPSLDIENDLYLGLVNQEKETLKKFIRSATKRGTVTAMHRYFEPRTEQELFAKKKNKLMIAEDDTDEDEYGVEDHDEDDFYVPQGGNLDGQLGYFIINPDGLFRQIWDNVNLFTIFYVATVTPFKIAFLGNHEYLLLDIIEYIVDVFFVIDIVVTFFTPILVKF